MANYSYVVEELEEGQLKSGVLHKNAIYLIAEEEQYFTTILIYMPNLREEGNEWALVGFPSYQLKATSFPQGGLSFIGATEKKVHEITECDMVDIRDSYRKYDNEDLYLIMDIKVINDELYFAQGDSLFKYFGDKKWKNIFDNEKLRKAKDGFIHSFDGFSKNEIYIGGEKGEIWLFNGNTWRPLEIPTNQWIHNIVCAPDGNVYLNAKNQIIIGRNDNWEKSINTNVSVDKIVWFKGKLYLLPKYADTKGLFCLENGEIKPIEVGYLRDNEKETKLQGRLVLEEINPHIKVKIPAGNTDMIASKDLLMITGNDSVILFNGNRWFNLFDRNKTEEELRASGTFYDPREL